MSDRTQTTFSIEELNKQFQQQYGSSGQPNPKQKPKPRVRPRTLRLLAILIGAVVLVAAVTAVVQGVRRSANPYNVTTYGVLDSKSEYQKQYESVNLDTAFVGLNETVNVSGQYAHVGLVNAIGSNSVIAIKIYDKETEDIFYQSEKVRPGTVLHMAVLEKPISHEDSTVIDYIVYDLEGNELGVYLADIKFKIINETEEEADDGGD